MFSFLITKLPFKTEYLSSSLKNLTRNISGTIARLKKSQENDIELEVTDEQDREYQQLAEKCFSTSKDHNCFLIHPYVKWGPQKVKDTQPEQQLKEAEALIRTLAPWTVHDKINVPLESLDKNNLFGSGTLEKLKKQVRGDPRITAVFVNTGSLRNVQIENLEKHFGVPVLDRYKIVMQILRLHATSKHAKLQVALAEIPYLKTKVLKGDSVMISKNLETRKLMLQEREQKIKSSIKKLRSQRELLRNRRKHLEYPVIAVVGYTNCGKTSLIKALTGEKSLQPRNQLFATLDVTMHAGVLPSNMEVLFVDTVGFISNIPTNLIECFVATLEDALYGDIILHVEDLASEDRIHQRNHVISTLEGLSKKSGAEDLLKKMITIGNKCDLVNMDKISDDILLPISAKTEVGIDSLRQILDELVLKNTGRVKITIRVPSGGDEMRWLYKNSTIKSALEDKNDLQMQCLQLIITESKLEQFKYLFIKK